MVFILKDTGSALGFVMFKERFTFWVKGPAGGDVRGGEEGGCKNVRTMKAD